MLINKLKISLGLGFLLLGVPLANAAPAASPAGPIPVLLNASANSSKNVIKLGGNNTWTKEVPLLSGLQVDDSGRARDGVGFYLRGVLRGGDLRKVVHYYGRKLADDGWEQEQKEPAPGNVLRMSYSRGIDKLVVSLSATGSGTIVLMAVGPYSTREQAITASAQ